MAYVSKGTSRVEVRMRNDFIDRIDARAAKLGITRSAFVKAAVTAALDPIHADGIPALERLVERGPHCEHRIASVCPECGGEETAHTLASGGRDA